MKIDSNKISSLSDNLSQLQQHPQTFEETVNQLFAFSYGEYQQLFNLDHLQVPNNTYQRVPVYNSENCVAILMLWGKDNQTAIHDHKNYDGHIKVLKGILSEISYNETANFITYETTVKATEGQSFPEEEGGIHSIVNNFDGISVSLHIYRTSQLNLQGVRLFDLENRKIAWLNDKASSCTWNLNNDAFEKMITV